MEIEAIIISNLLPYCSCSSQTPRLKKKHKATSNLKKKYVILTQMFLLRFFWLWNISLNLKYIPRIIISEEGFVLAPSIGKLFNYFFLLQIKSHCVRRFHADFRVIVTVGFLFYRGLKVKLCFWFPVAPVGLHFLNNLIKQSNVRVTISMVSNQNKRILIFHVIKL